jgi:hypothetical protein
MKGVHIREKNMSADAKRVLGGPGRRQCSVFVMCHPGICLPGLLVTLGILQLASFLPHPAFQTL